jgi:hypothetical protein
MRRTIAAALLAAALAGCASVAPWQRGDLARPQMAPDPAPAVSALREHVFASREAASGGATARGGGCGCGN